MTKRIRLPLLLLPLVFVGCGNHWDCDNIDKGKVNEEKVAKERELRNGYHLAVDLDRFTYSCFFYNGRDIREYIDYTTSAEDFKFKLMDDFPYTIQNKDVFLAVFIDKRRVLQEGATVKIKKMIVQKEVTTCDSLYHILYNGIAGNIDKLTKEKDKVSVVKLFDETIQGNIRNYINALSPAERTMMDSSCVQDFFVLDTLAKSNKYGFATSEYELKAGIKKYLDAIVQTILFKLNEKTWQQQQLVLTIDGYADENKWPSDVSKPINKSLMGIDIADNENIYNYHCLINKYVDCDKPDVSLPLLTHINDNCELSVVRAFVAAIYLRQQLVKYHVNAQILYRGGNVSPGKDVDYHRKIDVSMELKAASTSSPNIQQRVVPATKD